MPYTLNITFPPATPAPALGYRVRYWPTNNPANITTITVPSSPATITGLTEFEYAGDVSAKCDATTFSTPVPFTALVPGPATSTLTFFGYAAGQFTFKLSNTLPVPLVITYATADGFDNAGCAIGGGVTTDMLTTPTTLTIPAGSTMGTALGFDLGCGVIAYRRGAQIQVQGVPGFLVNGSTFVINGTTVTVVISSNCQYYAC